MTSHTGPNNWAPSADDDVGAVVTIQRRKWPDVEHYTRPAVSVGSDQFGTWFGLRLGDVILRKGRFHAHETFGGLILIPHRQWWTAWMPACNPDFDLYVDIATPTRTVAGTWSMVDLDLDVVRSHDGSVRVEDEDEFEQRRHRYPDHVVSNARAAAEAVLTAAADRRPPFGREAEQWSARWAALARVG